MLTFSRSITLAALIKIGSKECRFCCRNMICTKVGVKRIALSY